MAWVHNLTYAIRRAEQKQIRLPVPFGGLNFINNPLDFPATDAYLMDNFIARSSGAELRKGWRYWVPEANKLTGEVRSLMSYSASNPTNDALFASASGDGHIYRISSGNTAPVSVLTPSPASTRPGEWYSTLYVVPGGLYLCAVSEGAGYYHYKTGEGWIKVTLTFPVGDTTTTEQLAFCFIWKNRLWFLKANSTVAYYLPITSIAGTLSSFDFGSQLTHGGYLAFGTSWTYDSGSGIDDALIICSKEGDLLLYRGSDPDNAAAFGLQGIFYCGRLPSGRRGFCQHGGNTLILSEYGIINIADLVAGRLHTSLINGDIGYKINPRLARLITQYANTDYWALTPYPTEELLILSSPIYSEALGIRQSFVMNSLTNSWCSISSLDILSTAMYQGYFVFGTRTGSVILGFYGTRDGDSADGLTFGSEPTGRLQCSFNGMDSPTMNKRLLRTKLYGLSDTSPSFFIKFKAEYDLNELLSVSSPVAVLGSLWDSALWDSAKWETLLGSFHRWIGVAAFGKKLSMQMALRGSGGTMITDFEVLYEEGINL